MHASFISYFCTVIINFEFFFPAVASSLPGSSCNGSSSTYIRSQYNLNPPPPVLPSSSGGGATPKCHSESPVDLPPPGYEPSLTAPSESAPSTIEESNNPAWYGIQQSFLWNSNTIFVFHFQGCLCRRWSWGQQLLQLLQRLCPWYRRPPGHGSGAPAAPPHLPQLCPLHVLGRVLLRLRKQAERRVSGRSQWVFLVLFRWDEELQPQWRGARRNAAKEHR